MSEKISDELKKIVLCKLDTLPPNFKLAIGNEGSFTREELKKHVQKEDPIGIIFANMQLKFMKALASGEFSRIIAE